MFPSILIIDNRPDCEIEAGIIQLIKMVGSEISPSAFWRRLRFPLQKITWIFHDHFKTRKGAGV
jgi:hypothetical protein